jgi:hypothetical protein
MSVPARVQLVHQQKAYEGEHGENHDDRCHDLPGLDLDIFVSETTQRRPSVVFKALRRRRCLVVRQAGSHLRPSSLDRCQPQVADLQMTMTASPISSYPEQTAERAGIQCHSAVRDTIRPMASVGEELQELRRRRRNRRIAVAVGCVVLLILAGIWLKGRNSTMSCGDWQAEYSTAVLQSGGTMPATGHGTVSNLEQVRPEGCPIPAGPGA